MNSQPSTYSTRPAIYALLIILAAGGVVGRIMSIRSPTFGSNDRSRWSTVRSLVDDGTYVIGHRQTDPSTGKYLDSGIVAEADWDTIDKVLRPETSDFYSSKPPLLPTLLAGEYWLLKKAFGWSLVDDQRLVVSIILLTVNALPFIMYLVLLARILEGLGSSGWGRLYVLAAGCFGTLLTPFMVTLNNHTIAACSALFALYPFLRIWYRDERSTSSFVVAGFFAGFTAVNEFPAAAMAALFFLLLLLCEWKRAVFLFLPAAALPVAALLLTNHLAIDQWRPAYDYFGGPWYEYEGSLWKIDPAVVKTGIDWAYLKESRHAYAFHCLIGHHGLFTLSPIFLLTAISIAHCFMPGKNAKPALDSSSLEIPELKMVAVLTTILSVIVFVFYVYVINDRNRNYGGWTIGLRWLLWLTPFWLISILPLADWLAGRRWGRTLALLALAASVFTVTYSTNPWHHPWIYKLMEARGWIGY